MKNIKFIVVFCIAMLTFINENIAQQDPMYTQYFFNPLTVNSGYAGTRDALSASLLVREQWVGIEGAPQTQTLSIHSPLRNDKLAVGGTIIRDKVGPSSSIGIFGDFSYRFQVSEKSRLALGLKGGINFLSADLSELQNTEVGDISFQQNINSSPLPNFGASAYLWSEDYFLGISAPKLIQNNLDSRITDLRAEEKVHFFFMGGYVFELSPALKLKPTFMTKIVAEAPISVDLTANFLLDDKLWLGGAFRFGDSFGLLASYQLSDQLRLGYAFDYTLTELQKFTPGNSHEIMVSYDFIYKAEKLLSPRYF